MLFASDGVAESENAWPVLVRSAKGDSLYSQSRPVSWDSLVVSFYRVPKNDELSRALLDKQFTPKVNYIGQLNGMTIYDIIYTLDDKVSDGRYLKTIVLQKDKLHCMAVFYDFIDKDRYFPVDPLAPTYILDDKNLVVSKLSMTGTGGFMDEYYLYIPKDWRNGKIPIIVNDDVVRAELKNHIPKGYYAPYGKAFDINTLHFHSCITNTDVHCFEDSLYTLVDMQFKLDNGQLKLVSFQQSKTKQPFTLTVQ